MAKAAYIDLNDVESFPSRRDEDWKYTDVRRFLRAVPRSAEPFEVAPLSGVFGDIESADPAIAPIEHVFANGCFLLMTEDPEENFGDNAITIAGRKDLPERAPGPDLHILRFVSRATEEGWQASVGFTVGPRDHVVLLETYEGQGSYVANAVLNIAVMDGGRLERIVLADDDAEALCFSQANITLGAGAAFSQTVLATGAKLQRIETRLKHPGEGSAVRIDGAYLLAGKRHTDLTTEVDHVGGNGLTDQLTKGVVRDEARGVFQGRIIVREGADGTDARMGHHALITSDRGEVDAKPELEIYADDVSCAHGNTVGALDESALFYMEQRGIPADEARALLTEAFLMEVVDRIGHEGARERARAWLTERL